MVIFSCHPEGLWENAERQLVDRVFDAAKSKRQGVLGVERTLLFVDGMAVDGSVCSQCDYFSAKKLEACPLCGDRTEWRDITDPAVEKAILTGAEAEVVPSSTGRDRLLAEGDLGALLRY